MSRPAPPPLPLIGRHRLLAGLTHQIAEGRRTIVLTGVAGIGKTRLASALADQLEHPVVRIRLTPGDAEHALFEAISAALDVPLDSATPTHAIPRLGDALAAAQPLVLVLDGVDGREETVAEACTAWSATAPEVVVLVTCRVAIPCPHASTTPIGPLESADAEKLFIDRARRQVPDFAYAPVEAAAVAEAIAPLEGSPLALELAAPWVQVYAIDELGGALRAALMAHIGSPGSTLDAALRWTWDRFDAATHRIACHCALFQAPFTLSAVRHICGPGTASALKRLREHGLIDEAHRAHDAAPRRFRMSSIIRAWCMTRWDDALPAARVALARWLAGDAAVSTGSVLWANAGIGAVPAHDLADLRAAVRPSDPLPDDLFVDLTLRAHRVLLDFGPSDLHRAMIDRALAAAPPDGRAFRVLWLARGQAHWSGDVEAARESFARAEALGIEHGDDEVVLSAIIWLGHAAGLGGDRQTAGSLFDRARQMCADRSPVVIGEVLHHVAMDQLLRRAFDDAAGTLRTALAHARLADAGGLEYVIRMNLGFLHGERGAFEQALAHRTAALALIEDLPSPRNRADALLGCGHLLLQLGRLDDAEAMLVAAIEHHGRQGNSRGRARAVGRLGQTRIEQDRLTDAAMRCLDAERELRSIDETRGAGLYRAMRGLTLVLDGAAGAGVELIESGAAELGRGGEAGRSAWLHQVARLARALARMPDVGPPTAEPPPWLRPALSRVRAALALFDGNDPEDRVRAARLLGAADTDRCFEGRMSQRLLSVAFDAADASVEHREGSTLRVAHDARWFRLDEAPAVDLSKRTHPRRLLAALATARRRAPGRRLDRDALFAAGWPGEVAMPTAMGQRVHTAIYTLRRAGLAAAIERDRSGWRLAPTVHLVVGAPRGGEVGGG